MCIIWMKIYIGGLYTEVFYAVIPTSVPYFLCSAIPTSCYIFNVFSLLCDDSRVPLPIPTQPGNEATEVSMTQHVFHGMTQ